MVVRKVTLTVLLVVAAVFSSAARCTKEEAQAGTDIVANWLRDAKPAAEDVKPYSVFDEASRAKVNKALTDAPSGLSGDAAEVKVKLQATKSYQDNVLSLLSDVQRRSDADAADMRNVAGRSVTSTATTTVRTKVVDFLTEHGNAVLKDVACDFYWKAMTSTEQGWARTDLTSNGYHVNSTNFISNAADYAGTTLLTAIENEAYNVALTALPSGYRNFVLWMNYGNGVIEKVNQLTADRKQFVTYPNGVPVTRAWLYFVQLCMRPPGR